jgi:Cys-tRNA(Pro)/Cys-tRNA(Cys) deacylase
VVKNNVTRLLESRGIDFEAFELPNEKLSGIEAASYLGVEPELVYKTIVVKRQNRGIPVLVLVPAPNEVDLKALSRALGEKKVYLATLKEAEQITGLQTGGISPLALLNRRFQVIIDSAVQLRNKIFISGGQRGINILLATEDLVSMTNASIASISRG